MSIPYRNDAERRVSSARDLMILDCGMDPQEANVEQALDVLMSFPPDAEDLTQNEREEFAMAWEREQRRIEEARERLRAYERSERAGVA